MSEDWPEHIRPLKAARTTDTHPKESWWVTAPREGFTAYVSKEHQERMQVAASAAPTGRGVL